MVTQQTILKKTYYNRTIYLLWIDPRSDHSDCFARRLIKTICMVQRIGFRFSAFSWHEQIEYNLVKTYYEHRQKNDV